MFPVWTMGQGWRRQPLLRNHDHCMLRPIACSPRTFPPSVISKDPSGSERGVPMTISRHYTHVYIYLEYHYVDYWQIWISLLLSTYDLAQNIQCQHSRNFNKSPNHSKSTQITYTYLELPAKDSGVIPDRREKQELKEGAGYAGGGGKRKGTRTYL